MGQLFGTDGIRGRANAYPMTCDLAMKIGQAVGILTQKSSNRCVIIGRDTRISGQMLESALTAGIASVGVDVMIAGVIPTPGVAYLSGVMESCGAGIMISASHNPYYDNGIKIFQKGGIKLSDDQEADLEKNILGPPIELPSKIGAIVSVDDAQARYVQFLVKKFNFQNEQRKLKLVIDTANGAASFCAPDIFTPDIFDVSFIHNQPNGTNINEECGSQHTKDLSDHVKKVNADIGLAFDGDADRLIAVDETGQQITGDILLAVLAQFAKQTGKLGNNIVVSTVMSNVGFGNALAQLDIKHEITGVGDRKVLERMKETGALLGGEDSGHMIFLDEQTTGDGALSALKLIEVMLETQRPLSELAKVMTVYPQVLINVEVDASRPDFMKMPMVADAIKEVESQLGSQGRVLVRYSGTQPLLRVMVEGPEESLTRQCCERICEAIKKSL
ncbi:phosphoglucosamine mutase [Desulfobacter hydrogenophilus]|uniref:Phosphoglucosamine mutase n=1 Tax=Desulfobacter hydrogenophilus TaxID=2291 RepID=A0A328FH51_9BACT|nr:phosphoglucosamine mutase [Desulfobacter hydrogenophilus]NDY73551.1 phosphoglucosamine mutase [Desulfobacter hydrogenophilus]QBH14360.1 phosphoglucosamine mutase [Desulfobacter hydrogenophilus]RAM02315.1 phosphoglucosamine mutase [Desulfobacter hydrogenophilus]